MGDWQTDPLRFPLDVKEEIGGFDLYRSTRGTHLPIKLYKRSWAQNTVGHEMWFAQVFEKAEDIFEAE